MNEKRKFENKASNQKHLFLFLYCSVTLILISIFVFIDRDKFSVDGTSTRESEGQVDLAKLAPDYPLPQCYTQNDSASAILELNLSSNTLAGFAESLKLGKQEVSNEIEEYLRLRDSCGYVATGLKVDLKYSENLSNDQYQEIFNSYLEIRRKLKTISPRVEFEITIENI